MRQVITENQKELLLEHHYKNMNEAGKELIVKKAIELVWLEHPDKLSKDWDGFLTELNSGGIAHMK